MKKFKYRVGDDVVARKKITFLDSATRELVELPAGTKGKITEVQRGGFRTVRFGIECEVGVSIESLSPPSILDQITQEIFE